MTAFLKEKLIIISALLYPLFLTVSAQEIQYGLKFHSYNYAPELRTSLDLSPKSFFSFNKGFTMSFDVKFDFKEIHSYGYIFRIRNKEGNSIDLVLGDKNISFSSSTGNIVFSELLEDIKIRPEQWVSISVDVDISNEQLEIRIGESTQKWQSTNINTFKDINIVFGKNDYPQIQAIDVADMTVKDIKIQSKKNNEIYHWKLLKYATGGVYDELNNAFAKCENPDWVINQNTTWRKESTFTCEKNPYIAYNSDESSVAVADEHFFYTFSLNGSLLKKQDVQKELAYERFANQMIYNPVDSNYYAYNLVKEEDGREFAVFDKTNGSWTKTTAHHHYSDYWHHNRYFSAKNNKLYLFGGYGHHKYKKDIYMYDVENMAWSKEKLDGDNINPRYLSGLGEISSNRLLLFGGYGSQTGNQELSPQHYYDAYIIDVETMKAQKLWTLENPEENFVVSNSLIVDTINNCFYALCYPFTKFNTAIRLYKFSLDKPEYEILGDTIAFGFKDAFSYVDLFCDKKNEKMIAITSSSISADSIASISIYSLGYPPINKRDLFQSGKANNHFFIIITIILLSTLLVFISYKRKIRKSEITKYIKPEEDIPAENIEYQINNTGINTIRPLYKQAIFLFGGFQVIDKEGNDLTPEFKPLHKSLFLLILLNTIKNGKGISFVKLKEILWFDKSDESANNNRGVTLSKIRQILEHVGEVRFKKQGSYWTVEFDNDIYCDYYEALILIKKIRDDKEINEADIERLISIVSEGELLPNMQIEWADSFKSDFSNDLIDVLLLLIKQDKVIFTDTCYINIANAIFIYDPLNEDALRLKCIIQIKMGKNGLARTTYLNFTKEYMNWFGTEYKYSFDQVISNYS